MKKKWLSKLVFALVILVLLFIYFYLFIPFISFKHFSFYVFIALFLLAIIAYFSEEIGQFFLRRDKRPTYEKIIKEGGKIVKKTAPISERYENSKIIMSSLIGCGIVLLGLFFIFSFAGSKLLNAKSYSKQLDITNGTKEEFEETFSYASKEVTLPLIDKAIAFKLAQARLSEYGAQYSISNDYFSIISIKNGNEDKLIRVSPLEYSNFFVSISRINKGTIGYIMVDLVTKEATLVKVDEGLKYMPKAKFNKDLDRHIRLNYPKKLYSNKFFEIDDEGNPYWVIPTYKNEIGVISGANSEGVILVNPINGQIKFYKLGQEPTWVDRTIDSKLAEKQATNALKYKNGFINATLGQKKEVFQVSDGYNYFIKDNQTYYVSGITSPNQNDQTSIGFISINLTTKKAKKYNLDGITEMRAREIAKFDERVKAKNFEATWPILVNIKKIPSYFLTLKNDVQVQMYVFLDVSSGLKVSISNKLDEAYSNYLSLITGETEDELFEATAKITEIRDLNNKIEFMLENFNDTYFVVEPNISLDARFIDLNDIITIKYKKLANYCQVVELRRSNK